MSGQIIINNNFMIPKIWRIFRENHLQAKILLPLQMQESSSKWIFEVNYKITEEDINKNIEPLDYIQKYPHILLFDYKKYSIKKCLDWLVSNLDDDQWLLDDFRGEKSSLMDSRYNNDVRGQNFWANTTLAIFFAKQEDMNFFKVLKEDFKDVH